MKSLIDWLAMGLLVVGVALLVPMQATADAPDDEEASDDADEEADEEEAEESEEAEADAEDEDADAEADVEAEAEESAALFGDDEEEVADEEEEVEEEVSEEPRVLQGTWTKKFVFQDSEGFVKFQPRGWLQPRFRLAANPDDAADNTLAGTGFDFKRARFGFQVYMFDVVRVYLDTGWRTGSGTMVDYFVDVNPFEGLAVLRVGYFRPYFGRQLLMGTTTLQMIEYAQAWQDGTLNLNMGRDHGIGIHGMIAKGFEYGVGIWNGERGFSTAPTTTPNGVPAPGNIDFAFGGRIAVHPLAFTDIGVALPAGDESDTKVTSKPGLVIGAALMYNKRHNRDIFEATSNAFQLYYDSQLKLGAELGFKMKGFTFQGEFFMHKVSVQDDAAAAIKTAVRQTNDTVAENLDGTGLGFYAQLGYFIKPADLEISARFDMVDESTDLQGSRMYPGVGVSYYVFGNNLKVQLMYRLNMGTGYGEATANAPADPGYIPTTHDVFLMLQAAI